jgi:hypothetical protein
MELIQLNFVLLLYYYDFHSESTIFTKMFDL